MTKTTKTTTNSASVNPLAYISEAFDSLKGKFEVPGSAREFVTKGAVAAKGRVETAHEGALKFANGAEKVTISLVDGYANFARGLIDAAFANVQHSLETVEKIAAAKSLNEAVQIQVDAVRQSANANMERVRSAAEAARETVTEGAKEVQSQFSKMYSTEKTAA